MKHMKISLLAALVAAVGVSGTAQAQELNDRWEISGSYFKPKTEFDLRLRGTATDGVETVSGDERGGISDRLDGGNVEAIFRLTTRQRIFLGGYEVSGARNFGQSGAGTYVDGEGTSFDYTYDANARLDNQIQLYRLGYGYDFVRDEQFTVTGLVSVYGASLKSDLTTGGVATVNGEVADLDSRSRLRERKYAPGLGLAAEWRPDPKWDVRASVQGFRTQWGSFNTDGHFTHANAQVGYNFTPNWAGFVGYDWFELELEDGRTASGTVDGVDYTGNLTATARLRVHGPTAGVRYKF